MVSAWRGSKIVDGSAVSASNTQLIPFEFTASAAVQAQWTKTAVTGTVVLQKSCNGDDWVDVGSSADLAAVAVYFAEVENKGYHYLRLSWTISTGSLTTQQAWANVKG